MNAIYKGISVIGEKVSAAASRVAAEGIGKAIASNPGVEYLTKSIGKTVDSYERTGPKDISVCYKLLRRLLSVKPVTQREVESILGGITSPVKEGLYDITAKLSGSTLMTSILETVSKFPKETEAVGQAVEIMSKNLSILA